MEILASCTLEESKNYNGKLIIENGEGEKPDKVSLNIIVYNGDTSILSSISSNVKCITYIGDVDFTGIEIPVNRVFREISIDEYLSNEDSISAIDNVIILVRVPDNYSNMRVLKGICEKNSSVRIIGGNLLQIDGVRIGRYDIGKDKGSIIYNGLYDPFLELSLSEIDNVKDVIRKAKKKLSKAEDDSKPRKEKKSVKRLDVLKTFNSLFEGVEEEEF